MNEAVNDLYNFILENGGNVTAGSIENWFRLIRQAVRSSTNEQITPENSFDMLTEGMAGRFYREGITTPKLLEAIRQYCADYIRESKEEEAFTIPDQLGAVFPNKAYLPNNEFEHQLIKGAINEGPTDIVFSHKGKPGEVSAKMEITRPAKIEGLEIRGNYNQYDAEISRGIDDIFMDPTCDNFFSFPQLYRTITHNKDGKPSDKDKEEMRKSIEAQRITPASGNIEKVKEDARKRGINVDRIPDDFNDMLLDLRGGHIKSGGEVVEVYYIKERPLPSLFGALTKQEIRIPADVYYIRKIQRINGKDVPTTPINNNTDRIAIKGYFVERIAAMKDDLSLAKERQRQYNYRRKKNDDLPEKALSTFQGLKTHTILYASAFEAAGVADKTAATLSRHKVYIEDCLKYWTATGFIKGFRPEYGKRKDSPDRVEIYLD